MAEVTLYTSDTEDEIFSNAESLLETAYLEYSTEVEEGIHVPKLEIEREKSKDVYIGMKEIDEGLDETDLEDLDRRF